MYIISNYVCEHWAI